MMPTREPAMDVPVRIRVERVALSGEIVVPRAPRGIVVFAHGSGSGRHSPRNRYVAGVLQQERLATLLFDLLTEAEEAIDERTRQLRFDIDLLSRRLVAVVDWVKREKRVSALPIGLFGASTGAAAALIAAAERPAVVGAVVSRGGRPDLAGASLGEVRAPTLLIVGGLDDVVLALNEETTHRLGGPVRLEVVAGATHLFEEPGALEEVARLAGSWFVRHLATPS